MRCFVFSAMVMMATSSVYGQNDANRLTYLDDFCDPYYPTGTFAKLITPQWVGDDGVEAVVTLGIDDMRDVNPYESYLRPILERLKQIDGRAPVSIMTNSIAPDEPHLQTWLKEGLSIETHTADHPCPCLQGGDFARAKSTYDRCVEQISSIPGNRPVAFRFPCMDSLNTPSPRAFAEILNKTTDSGKFLQASSSVLVLLTANDPALPTEIFWDTDGRPRFDKYVPFQSFVNKIENYPYPYVIGRLCWEFPVAVPDDWQGQNLHGAANPQTTEDIKVAIDATVLKQGMANITFHPGGWIRNQQVVSIVDHIAKKHGRKVLFLNFQECMERINKHLLLGQPIRSVTGQDNGVRLVDLNADGFLDVCISNESMAKTRVWLPQENRWHETSFPTPLVCSDKRGQVLSAGVRFGVVRDDGHASILVCNESIRGGWHFDGQQWIEDPWLVRDLQIEGQLFTVKDGRDTGVRLRDIDRDGRCELIVSNPQQQAIWTWADRKNDKSSAGWQRTRFALPASTAIVDSQGRDAGLRFVDLDEDGRDDVIFSNQAHASIHLFASIDHGWTRSVNPTEQQNARALPMISRQGTDNGAWFAARHMWLQNEDTNRLPDGVDRRSFVDLLGDQELLPKNPQAALQSMRVTNGFRIELVATEPLVRDPIAFDWGPDGKFWVVEMADYPLGLNDDGTPAGRVRYLEDTDNDGQYDKSTLFLDGIPFPTGVMPWRDGVLISAAPEIFFAADTDGDGKADKKEVLYRGFGEGNQQHRVNGFAWGLDNWIYVANGDSGGTIESLKTGKSIEISGRDLRIRPDTGDLDPQTGQTQFSRRRDDWGNWFSCTNAAAIRHVALDDHYVRRNPHHAPPAALRTLAHTNNTRLFPISRVLSHWEGYRPPRGDEPHVFTSASGTSIYRDDLFGPRFAHNVFTCEPIHNMIHRQVLEPDGTSFISRRAADESAVDFLASSDSWFRPTTVRTGPDGALWIADMYRLVIEHAEYIDDRTEKELTLRAGKDQGRIYRIAPLGKPARKIPRFDTLSVPQLAAKLNSPNGWQRDTAQRLLIQSNREEASHHVGQRLGAKHALTRLHALCTLDGLGTLQTQQLLAALDDPHPGVRRNAIRIAESHLSNPSIIGKLLQKTEDEDPQVILQLASTLGETRDVRSGQALGRILLGHQTDQYLVAAVMSSLNQSNVTSALTVVLSAQGDEAKQVDHVLTPLMEIAAAYGQSNALLQAFHEALKPNELETASLRKLSRLAQVAKRNNIELGASLDPASAGRLTKLISNAEVMISNSAIDLDRRLATVELLSWAPSDNTDQRHQTMIELLDAQNDLALQQAAVASLRNATKTQIANQLLTRWPQLSPGIRDHVLDLLLTRKTWSAAIVQQLQRGQLTSADLSPSHQQRLFLHGDTSIQEQAKRLLNRVTQADRQELIQTYRDALDRNGDKEQGRQLFMKHCSTCHQIHDVGHAVGPDLLALKNRSAEAILIAVLDPNRSIEDKYRTYTVHTNDGQSLAGVLDSETGNSLTLKMKEGKQHVILRRDIDELVSSNVSLMPEGMEKVLPKRSMADLLAYVTDLGPPPKKFSGNKVRVINADQNGVLKMPVSASRIYGSTVVLEPTYGNLGFWQSEDDRASWSINVPETGEYEILMDYACENGTANNAFTLNIGSQQITGKVAGTGTWDDYRQSVIGRLQLEAGSRQAVFRSQGPINNCLIDLRTIVIQPLSED